jgi:hypothetical protein
METHPLDALKDAEGITALYFYPSTLRMLGSAEGGAEGAAFSGISRARLFVHWSDTGQATTHLAKAVAALEPAGFENLFSLRSAANTVAVYLLEAQEPQYVFSFSGEGGTFVLDVRGELDGATLQTLATMDPAKAIGLLQLMAPGGSELPTDAGADTPPPTTQPDTPLLP